MRCFSKIFFDYIGHGIACQLSAAFFSRREQVDQVVWYQDSSDSCHAVGGKEPNGLGLYDMSGNVWEWCEDVYQSDAGQLMYYRS